MKLFLACLTLSFFHPGVSVSLHAETKAPASQPSCDRTYPIDIHCVAQSLITLAAFRGLEPRAERLAQSVLDWAMKRMWDKRGFFYYRVLRAGTIRTSYMRWSQAWMLHALLALAGDED